MVNKETKKITIEVGEGLFTQCNCCHATSNDEVANRTHFKKVDKTYKITFGNPNGIVVTACEDCLKQLIGEITVALNGNIKEKDNLNAVKEFCKDKIKELEEIEDCDADEIHDCETSIDAFRDVLAFIHSLEK